ncbi:hypothetical protein CRT60_33875 [Azospirillum palustre]|uniref:Uncharacterized protein n=1 Tax=Azospirillum palustre TaxID=2044885 RepID=A0A2B8B9X1_9PROT|nr:hypothetical protein [Azospirillum palustre]PGH54731.1 hypothetical protein CRT60_33875 [Azospirillum palustre]
MFAARLLCELPVDSINRVLGTELEVGCAWLSSIAHRHIAVDCSDDYSICIVNLELVISQPMYVRQSDRHARNFELIRRIDLEGRPLMLVAVSLERNDRGNYNVRSSYLITETDLEKKKRSGSLKLIIGS